MRTASPKSGKEAEECSPASFVRISEGDQVQPHIVAEHSVRLPGQAGDHQLAGGADDGLIQVPTEGVTLLVTGAATVILAMGAGKTAARAIDEALSKK